MQRFFKPIALVNKELWISDRKLLVLFYLLTLPNASSFLFWSLAIKDLADLVTEAAGGYKVQAADFNGVIFYIFTWFIIRFLIESFHGYVDDKLNRTYTVNFHEKMTDSVGKIDLQTFEDSKFLDILHRAKDSSDIILSVFKSWVELISFLLQVSIGAGSLFIINPILPLIVGVFVVIDIVYNNRFYSKRRELEKELTQTSRKSGQLYGYFFHKSNIEEIKIYDLFSYFKKRFSDIENILVTRHLDLHKKHVIGKVILVVLDSFIVDIGSRAYITYLALNGRITIGEFSFFFAQVGSMIGGLHGVGRSINQFNSNVARLDYYEDFVKYSNVLDYSSSKQKPDLSEIKIEFKNVGFSYPGIEERVILKNFNLTINADENVAIIGLNGAGKTTFIKLLLRFYDPTEGDILINGINLKNIDIKHYYKSVAALFQDYVKYELDVEENIILGRINGEVDKERVVESLKKSSAYEFVKDFPDQTKQVLGRQFDNGIQPSLGQWQKIALARTFYRDPALLILDEPTASIDAKAEAEIFDTVDQITKDKTVIIISHRFSTVRKADRIVLIEDGKIVEEGAHAELIKNDGKYAELFNLQARGYQ